MKRQPYVCICGRIIPTFIQHSAACAIRNAPDREPQPTDGPDYHEDHRSWVRRQSLAPLEMRAWWTK